LRVHCFLTDNRIETFNETSLPLITISLNQTPEIFLKLGCVQVATMNTISFYEFRLASRAIARTIKQHMHSLKYKPIVFSCNIDNAFMRKISVPWFVANNRSNRLTFAYPMCRILPKPQMLRFHHARVLFHSRILGQSKSAT